MRCTKGMFRVIQGLVSNAEKVLPTASSELALAERFS